MPMLSQYKKSGCNTLVFLALAAIIISDSTFRNHPHVLLILKLLSIPSIIIAFSCIKDSTFTNNYSDYVGGAITTLAGTTSNLSVDNTTFENNHTRYDGGAIGNYSGLSITKSIFKNNKY